MTSGAKARQAWYVTDYRMIYNAPAWEPKPGEGPPEWMRKKGGGKAECHAVRASDGRVVTGYVRYQGDPGYLATSKMALEAAIAVASSNRTDVATGYETPSSVLGPERLVAWLDKAKGHRSDYGGKFIEFKVER